MSSTDAEADSACRRMPETSPAADTTVNNVGRTKTHPDWRATDGAAASRALCRSARELGPPRCRAHRGYAHRHTWRHLVEFQNLRCVQRGGPRAPNLPRIMLPVGKHNAL